MVTKTASEDLAVFSANRRFLTVLADPPWRFQNSTGKVAPEHRRLSRYGTLSLNEIKALPVATITAPSHLYLWVPNALVAEGLAVMAAWGFTYKSNIVWHKIRKDGGSDGRGWVLFPERHRTGSIRGAGQERQNACARASSSEFHRDQEAGAFPEAGRALSDY
jgi:N6-adenosine-specific RNA methylase IME4